MSSVDDLVAWLRAQLDEDERVAHNQMSWLEQVQRDRVPSHVDEILVLPFDELGSPGDPVRVLREVESKRRIVNRIWDAEWGPQADPGVVHSVIRLLALPYDDRPGHSERADEATALGLAPNAEREHDWQPTGDPMRALRCLRCGLHAGPKANDYCYGANGDEQHG